MSIQFCTMYFFTCNILLLCFFMGTSLSRVLELGENFPEIRKEGGYWLVKFYAPWCGHCKKLEPTWNAIARSLARTNIRVGRIDCHRFPSAASEFEVRGFPTIKFITADADHTFHGDREEENIVKFAVRMAGPPVQLVHQFKDLDGIKVRNNLFFMYVGDQKGTLWNTYYDVALKLQPHVNFYSMNAESAEKNIKLSQVPSVFVYKDDQMYFYTDVESVDSEKTNLNSSVFKWVNEERFETFPKVSRGNINELIQTNKYLVLAIVEESKKNIPVEMLEFRSMVENLVIKNRSKYYKDFQFGWVGSPELANSIAMKVLPLPHLLVLDSRNHHHYLPETDCSEMTGEMLDTFLQNITNQSVPALGGDGFFIRIYRMYFDTSTSFVEMWIGNPILTTVLIGLPLSVLSFIIYSVCCDDITENYEEDDDDSDSHEKMD